jgi:hypothetical protein
MYKLFALCFLHLGNTSMCIAVLGPVSSLATIFLSFLIAPIHMYCTVCKSRSIRFTYTEAEFLDVIGTKVLRVFLLAIYGHLYTGFYFTPLPLPP